MFYLVGPIKNFAKFTENTFSYRTPSVAASKLPLYSVIIYDKADEVIEELFQSIHSRFQITLETSMKGIDFDVSCVHLMYYKCHKINPNWYGS